MPDQFPILTGAMTTDDFVNTIRYLRNSRDSDAVLRWDKFKIHLEENIESFCSSLNTRWLVSVCDTYADFAEPNEASCAMLISVFAGTEKLAFSLRRQQVINPGRRFQGQMWDGMTAFCMKSGDHIRHLSFRIRRRLRKFPHLEAIYDTVCTRMLESDSTTLSLINSMHPLDLGSHLLDPSIPVRMRKFYRSRATISDKYAELYREKHSTCRNYGAGAARRFGDRVGAVAAKNGVRTILDYGCGSASMSKKFGGRYEFQNYDPAIEEYSDPPRRADMVICCDVLEHVEPKLLNAVLIDLVSCTRVVCFLNISTRLTGQYLSNGENVHIIVKKTPWWRKKVSMHFDILEETTEEKSCVFVCQPRPRQ